ncbi:MAG: 1-(5-phosphoribosyl)-5-[(5-phosphoribosylamino)methylideneamino]imidazole-4-carboxamide isomerase [Fidelibacterota bacterium]
MIEIIPAIDIIDGACVRLRQGRYEDKTVYDTDPLRVAKKFESAGLKRLHCVDLDGARSGHAVNTDTIRAICNNTNLRVDVGGGIKTDADIRKIFASGAAQITAGSIAVQDPGRVVQWLKTFGAERIILGADFRKGRISVSGWQEDTSLDLMDFLDDYISRGIRTVISTDIFRDGMLAGSAEKTYARIKERYPGIYLIASGGVSAMQDIRRLDELDIDAVIVGKALYEGHISLDQIRRYRSPC